MSLKIFFAILCDTDDGGKLFLVKHESSIYDVHTMTIERPTKEELQRGLFGPAIERGATLMARIAGRNPWETPEEKERFTKDTVDTSTTVMEELSEKDTKQGGRDFILLFLDRFPKDQYPDLKDLQENCPDDFERIKTELVDALLIEDPARREEKIKDLLRQIGMKSEVEGDISELFRAAQEAETEEEKVEIREKAGGLADKFEKIKKYGISPLFVIVFVILLIVIAAWNVAEKGKKR